MLNSKIGKIEYPDKKNPARHIAGAGFHDVKIGSGDLDALLFGFFNSRVALLFEGLNQVIEFN